MIGRRAHCLVAALLAIALAACNDGTASVPSPVEITNDAVAEFCGMSLAEHAGPKAQIFLRGETNPHWFASVHDAFAYMMLRERPNEVVAIYVNDMGKAKNWDRPEAGSWVEARKAVFVIESRQRGGMDENEAVPFSVRAAAAAFSSQFGGSLVSFADMPRSYILQESRAESADRDAEGSRVADKRRGGP
jgi:copper chaperone NosL